MRAHSTVEVDAGAVLRVLRTQPPLTVRRLRDADPDLCTLCLVGTAAGPLAGDDLTLQLIVNSGARVRLIAAGATIAQGRGHDPAAGRLRVRAVVGSGAELLANPGPLVVAEGASVEVEVNIELAQDATLTWQEMVVLGRTAEPAGRAVLAWKVWRERDPLLHQDVDLASDALASWPGMLGGQRVFASTLRVGPEVAARTAVWSPTAVTQRLAERATLTTVLAPDAATAHRTMNQLDHLDQSRS